MWLQPVETDNAGGRSIRTWSICDDPTGSLNDGGLYRTGHNSDEQRR
jgi:hypothetical protein